MLHEQNLDSLICRKLGLTTPDANLDSWKRMLETLGNPERSVEVAVVGKYISRQSAYESIYEALTHGGIANRAHVQIRRVEAGDIEENGIGDSLDGVHGVLVPGGFGMRGIEGKISAIRYAREQGIPFFGICLGMQCAVIEFARNVCGMEGANSSEFEAGTSHPVIDLMETQRAVTRKGGTMRLGSYVCRLAKGTRARKAYGTGEVSERHRHRYELNNAFREALEKNGLVFSGLSPDGDLVELVELKEHPWFVACQCHPEFQSTPLSAHPLFRDFVKAAVQDRDARGKSPAQPQD